MSGVKGAQSAPFAAAAWAIALTASCFGHIGSPDVFFQGKAGPYPVLVTIRPPDVIPGIARIEVRALSSGVEKIELTPTPMTGPAAQHPPVADLAVRSAADPQYFEGALWLMSMGSWEVHVRASGKDGSGELPVPVPALAIKTRPMDKGTSYFLFGMMLFLTVGFVAIVTAGTREAQVQPGLEPAKWDARSVARLGFVSLLMVAVLWFGNRWWSADAESYARKLYKPLGIAAMLDGPDHLNLQITDPGWLAIRRLDDLVPDHGHLMHLFLIRWPAMDEVFHLHPDQAAPGFFSLQLPSLPAGRYRLYADIVHENGFAETAAGQIALPDLKGPSITGDDAGGSVVSSTSHSPLTGGFQMVWNHDMGKPVVARRVSLFSFEIIGPDGNPVYDLEPYMGMGGHAEFVKDDGSVFAHVHPTGSVPMASVAVASADAMKAMHETKIGPEVSFPYGLPTPGHYHVFVQMRRAGKVETGGFSLKVD